MKRSRKETKRHGATAASHSSEPSEKAVEKPKLPTRLEVVALALKVIGELVLLIRHCF